MGGSFLKRRTRTENEIRPGIELNFRHAKLDTRATRFFVNRENFFERWLSIQNRDGVASQFWLYTEN
jgi:hypothetical protein